MSAHAGAGVGGPGGPGWFCPRCGKVDPAGGACPDDGTTRQPASSRDLVGHVVDRYTLVASLGRGGHGDVYRAIDPRIGAVFALKVVASVDAEALTRVRREAQAVNRLGRADVARIHDCGALPGDGAYLVMDLVEGVTLEQRLRRGPALSPAEAVTLIGKLLAVLGAAHAAGLVHRDVKPANLMLTADGRVVLLDFGLVRFVELAPSLKLTATGVWVGTPTYMAPEQIRAAPVDARADLYAAAVLLFELLAGRPPFIGASDFAVLEGHIEHAPPDLRALAPLLPPALAAVVARGLAKDPAARWPSAEAFAAALAEVGVAAAAPGAPFDRRRARWPLAAALVAGAGLVGAGFILVGDDGDAAAPATSRSPQAAPAMGPQLRGNLREASLTALRAAEDQLTTFERMKDGVSPSAIGVVDEILTDGIRLELLTAAEAKRVGDARARAMTLRARTSVAMVPASGDRKWTDAGQDIYLAEVSRTVAGLTRAGAAAAPDAIDAAITAINDVLLQDLVDARRRGELLRSRAALEALRPATGPAAPPR